jgi:hypothetical protein
MTRTILGIYTIWAVIGLAVCKMELLRATIFDVHVPFTLVYFTPIVLFALCYSFWSAFHDWVHELDMRVLLILHSCRWVGFGTLFLYFYEITAPQWSIPAGVGDVTAAVALTSLAVMGFKRGRVSKSWLMFWNAFGLADFVVVLVLAVLFIPSSIGLLAGDTAVTTADVALSFPFNYIPTVVVPFLFCTHLIVFLQLMRHGGPDVEFEDAS